MFIADVKSQAEETPIDTQGTALCKEGPRRTAGVSPRGHPRCLEALSVPALAAQDPRPHPGSACPPATARPGPGGPATDAAGRQSPAWPDVPCSPRTHGKPRTQTNPWTSVQTHPHTRAHSRTMHTPARPCKPVNRSRTTHICAPRTHVHSHAPPCTLTFYAHPCTTHAQSHSTSHTRAHERTNTTHLCTRVHTCARACKPTSACSREHDARPDTALHRAPDCAPQPAPPSTPRVRPTHTSCRPGRGVGV